MNIYTLILAVILIIVALVGYGVHAASNGSQGASFTLGLFTGLFFLAVVSGIFVAVQYVLSLIKRNEFRDNATENMMLLQQTNKAQALTSKALADEHYKLARSQKLLQPGNPDPGLNDAFEFDESMLVDGEISDLEIQ